MLRLTVAHSGVSNKSDAQNSAPSSIGHFSYFWKRSFKQCPTESHHQLNEDVIPSEIHTGLYSQFGEKCLSRTRVFEWAKEFRDGRDRVENEPHHRRPRTSVTPENINRIDHLILDKRRINVREVSEELGISIGSFENIIHNELKFSKVSARWVPGNRVECEFPTEWHLLQSKTWWRLSVRHCLALLFQK